MANPLTARTHKGINTTADEGQTMVAQVAPTLDADFATKYGQNNQHIDGGAGLFVAHSLKADGFDAGEDGTGRGTPPVLVAVDLKQVTSKANRSQPGPVAPTLHQEATAVAFTTEQTPKYSHDAALTLTKQSPTGGGQPQCVLAPSLTASNNPSRSPQSSEITQQVEAVHAASYAVRRLLPLECERLQGFEDEYTLVPVHSARHRERCEHYDSESPALRVIVAAGVTALPCCGAKVTMKLAADAPRYKALGNSFAVNVVRWIGQRIQLVDGRGPSGRLTR